MNEDLNIIFGEQGAAQLAASMAHIDRTVKQLSSSVDAMEKELGQGSRAMDDMGNHAKKTSGLLSGLGREIGAVVGAIAIGTTVKESINAFADFGQGLADLSSITGLTGDDLANMGEVAREMGTEVEGGATAALKAMEAIGSAKPELLESAEALTQVTKAANVLAQASGDTLPQAAQNLTGIMNQFGAGAEQADRYINVLAAGSLAGAANITELAESMKQSGAIASAFNVSIEETTAALEALADKSIKGGEAGTALRNVLARMAATEALPRRALEALNRFGVDLDVVSDKSRPFSERLKEMSKVAGDTAAIVEIFGIENQAAAQILLNSTKRVDDLTKAVTGTRTAYDQAKTRTTTFKEELKRLGRQMQDLAITAGEALKPLVSILADVAKVAVDVAKFFLENKRAAVILAASIAILNANYIAATAALVANTAAAKAKLLIDQATAAIQTIIIVSQAAYITVTNLLTGSITAATAAQRIFNLVLSSNPAIFIATAIAGLAAAYVLLSGKSKEALEAERRRLEITKGINSAIKEASAQIGRETASLELLVRGIKNENTSKAEKKALTDQLISQYGAYLSELDKEAVKAGNVEAAYLKIKDAIIASVTAKQKAAAIEDLFGKQLEIQRDNAFKLSEALEKQVAYGRMDEVFSADQIIRFTEEFRKLPQELQRAADAGRGISLAAAKNFDLTPLQVETVAFFDDFSKIYNNLNKQASELGKSADATPFVREFNAITRAAEELDAGIAEINSKFGASFAEMLGGVAEVATGFSKTDEEAVAAAGSIDALRKQIEALQKAFSAASTESERNSIFDQIIRLEGVLARMEGKGLDGIEIKPIEIKGQLADIEGAMIRAQEQYKNLSLTVQEEAPKMQTAWQKLVERWDANGMQPLIDGLEQIKGAFIDFGAQAAQSIGYAIGSAESVADAFRESILALLVEVPKLAGMALLNAAAFPANAAIALPLAIAGLALLGLSGLIKGFGDRKRKQREGEAGGMDEMGSVAGRSSPGGLAALASAQTQPIEVNVTAELDGIQMNGLIRRVTAQGAKHNVKGG